MYKAAILIALVQASSLAFAQAPPDSGPPVARAAGTAPYVCGGVGTDDQERMKAGASQHDLMLTFAASSGAYLADVDVEIRDSKGGVVLAVQCDGPIMLVDLPAAGNWRVTARANGQTRQTTIKTRPGRHVQASFIWPAGGA